MPVVIREYEPGTIGFLKRQLPRFRENATLQSLSFRILPLQVIGQDRSTLLGSRRQQFDGQASGAQPAGSVKPRGDNIADVRGTETSLSFKLGRLQERPHAERGLSRNPIQAE